MFDVLKSCSKGGFQRCKVNTLNKFEKIKLLKITQDWFNDIGLAKNELWRVDTVARPEEMLWFVSAS